MVLAIRKLAFCAVVLASVPAAAANDNAHISGIVTGTYQAASQSRIEGREVVNEANAQLYLQGYVHMGPGAWHLEVRGSTTPRNKGIKAFYAEVNDNIGETLGPGGHGRIAATQLYYALPIGGGELRAGLLDATGNLDINDIADDEYTQFLGSSFVNNPTIDYPKFSLGAAYHSKPSRHFSYRLFVSSSSGLQDAKDPTYGNVFAVGGSDKGVFASAGLLWAAGRLSGDVGIWYNSGNHPQLGAPDVRTQGQYGAYTSATVPLGPGKWQAWAGLAEAKIASAINFLAIAYSQPIGDTTLGIGFARIGVSDSQRQPAAPVRQAELYWRIHVISRAYVTPDVQYVDHSGFDARRNGVVVAGLRAGIEF